MSTNLNASLVLSTTTSSNNANRTSFTWNNIDLRMLLGDMYNKYDRFNLCLNTIASGLAGQAATTFFSAQVDAQVLVRVSGLPWINNGYNITATSANNTGNTVIASFLFVNNSQQTQYFYGSNMAVFGKNSDIASITIDYIRVSDLATPAVTNTYAFPHMAFIFDIFGVDDYKINQVDQRIIR
jgi:hypothetical protein